MPDDRSRDYICHLALQNELRSLLDEQTTEVVTTSVTSHP